MHIMSLLSWTTPRGLHGSSCPSAGQRVRVSWFTVPGGNVIDVLFGHIEDDLDPALHFQRIAQWGSCGKAPVVPQNRPPGPAIADRIDANHA